MNLKFPFFKSIQSMVPVIILFISTLAFAKEVNLYEQPKPDTKIVGTIDLSAGIIPIYTPKASEWVKIADPKNGNVGWVKWGELNNTETSQSIFTFTQSIDNKTPMAYQIIRFGQPANLTSAQTNNFVKKIQTEQHEMLKSIQNMMRDMNQLFYNDWYFWDHNFFPFFAPVVVMHAQNSIQPSDVSKKLSTATPAKNNADDQIKK